MIIYPGIESMIFKLLNEIIMSKNETTIKHSFELSTDDAQFCQLAFHRYSNHLKFVTELADDSYRRIKEHLKKHRPTEPYNSELNETQGTVRTLRIVEQHLTKSFAAEIQIYFRNKYNIDFDSLSFNVEGEIIQFESWEPLVNNIVNQVGSHFHIAGGEQIKKRFLETFQTLKCQPVLKGYQIQFPSLASYYEHSNPESYINLKPNNYFFDRCFLDAIHFFFSANLQQPKAFTELKEKWRNKIEPNIEYPIIPNQNVSLKFFKNRRVNLMFNDAAKALHFFNHYELEGVAMRNIANASNK